MPARLVAFVVIVTVAMPLRGQDGSAEKRGNRGDANAAAKDSDPDAPAANESPKDESPANEGTSDSDAGKSAPERTARIVESLEVILAQSDKLDALWGYSNALGKWTRLGIPPSKKPLVAVIGPAFGFYVGEDGHHVYAYSGVTGTWAEQVIPEDKSIVSGPTTSSSVGVVETDDHIYGFSPTTCRWAGQKVATKFKANSPGRSAVQFTRVIVRDQGKLFIFSDSTGRWSSAGDAGDDKDEGGGAKGNARMGGGRGGGFFPERGASAGMGGVFGGAQANNARSVRGGHLIMKWNEARDTFWAYSDSLGRWTKLKLDKPAAIPTVSSYVGVVKAPDAAYA